MSVQTLYTAATGMESLQTKLDVIANNLANVNTTGFKSDRANFEDLFYRHEPYPGNQDSQTNYTPTGTQIGLGSRVQSTQTNFQQGAFQETGEPLDLAIEGQGFFQVQDSASGQILLHAGRQFRDERQLQHGHGLGSNRPPDRAADYVSPGYDRHLHHGGRAGAGPDRVANRRCSRSDRFRTCSFPTPRAC